MADIEPGFNQNKLVSNYTEPEFGGNNYTQTKTPVDYGLVGPVSTMTFPSDLRSTNSASFPFVRFEFVKYGDRWAILENEMSSSKTKETKATTLPVATICLPLPGNFQNNVSPQWEMSGTQILSGALELYNQFKNGGNGIDGLVQNMRALALNDLTAKTSFIRANPKKQAFFNAIDPRTFSFTYTLSPQTEKEADTIIEIVKEFTKNSLPSLVSTTDAFFDFPAECNISFHGVKGFPKLSSCVCNSVTTDYSPATMQILRSGHPIQIALQLVFTETDLRTKEAPGM